MKKHNANLSMLTLWAAAILVMPALSRAQDTARPPVAAPVAPPAVAPAAAPDVAPDVAPTIAPAVTPAAPQTPPAKKRTVAAPATPSFHGTLTALDTNAMTLTVEKRTFNMTSETIVTKDGKPAVLADGVAGEPVRGAYKKSAGGKLDAVSIQFGGTTEGKKKEPAGN
jgi:hypothetical protein